MLPADAHRNAMARAPWLHRSFGKMKATTLLVRQHRKIDVLLTALEHQRAQRESLLLEVMDELLAHMAMEESLFHPAARRALDSNLKSQRESHHAMRSALLALTESMRCDKRFIEKTRALRRAFEAHLALDEGALFPDVTCALDEEALEALGNDMEALSSALVNRQKRPARGLAVHHTSTW